LPLVDGGEVALEDFAGKRLLLVFSDPHCGPCNELAPRLEALRRANPGFEMLILSRGDLDENRKKVREHNLTVPVALQRKWEISKQYATFATPVAYMIDSDGVLASDLAMGAEKILALAGRRAAA